MRQRAFEGLRSCNRCAKGELPRNAPVSWKLKRDFPRLGWSKRGRWHARPDARRRRQAALDSSKISNYWSCNASEAVWTIEIDHCEYDEPSAHRGDVETRLTVGIPRSTICGKRPAWSWRHNGDGTHDGYHLGTPRVQDMSAQTHGVFEHALGARTPLAHL